MQIHTPGFGPGLFLSLSLTCAIVNREIGRCGVLDFDRILCRTLRKPRKSAATTSWKVSAKITHVVCGNNDG
jgi:hypothetical protein